jgi:outer membrane protein OmpA-like peptidoglycan-associated protein
MNYDQIKRKGSHENDFWVSYADLFMLLSVVFLFLFAAASLRSGSEAVRSHMENVQLTKQNEDLKEQIKVYSTLKDDYVENKASEDERLVYENLMDKLKLLEQENRQEASGLRKQAAENEQKEKALNQYQQLIRNIINANILAKQQISNREETIKDKEEAIEVQSKDLVRKSKEISSLEKNVKQKEADIEQNKREMAQIEANLQKKVKLIQAQRRKAKITESQMQKQIAEISQKSKGELSKLQSANQQTQAELNSVSSRLSQTEGKLNETAGQLRKAEGSLLKTKEVLQQVEGEKGRALASVKGLESTNKNLNAELEQAKAAVRAKKDLISKLQGEFDRSGVKAKVDAKTGDVTLDFDQEYFDTDSSRLKPGMVKKLKDVFPAYTKAIFQDRALLKKVASVEIIGFASPTYQGRYVNPSSIDPKDKAAINYNLKLSFERANAIFNFAFSKDKIAFADQENLLPLVKVVGRGYLPDGVKASDIEKDLSENDFCAKYNCKKAQRVLIKFNLRD